MPGRSSYHRHKHMSTWRSSTLVYRDRSHMLLHSSYQRGIHIGRWSDQEFYHHCMGRNMSIHSTLIQLGKHKYSRLGSMFVHRSNRHKCCRSSIVLMGIRTFSMFSCRIGLRDSSQRRHNRCKFDHLGISIGWSSCCKLVHRYRQHK